MREGRKGDRGGVIVVDFLAPYKAVIMTIYHNFKEVSELLFFRGMNGWQRKCHFSALVNCLMPDRLGLKRFELLIFF